MSACTIYALTDVAGTVRYIGKTVNPKKRLYAHLADARRGKRVYTCYWIRSMQTPPLLRPLMVVEEFEGSEMERRTIAFYRQRGCRLTNVTVGGDGITPKARAEMRAAKLLAAATQPKRPRPLRPPRPPRPRPLKVIDPAIPEVMRDYFRVEGSRGGHVAAAKMTPAERSARALKGSRTKAERRANKTIGARKPKMINPGSPAAADEYFRQQGSRGGRTAAANMTPEQRIARALKGAETKRRNAQQAA